MVNCPACGEEVGADIRQCPACHLSTDLFVAVRDAAGEGPESAPAYLRTIGELLATVDVSAPAASPPPPPAPALLTRSGGVVPFRPTEGEATRRSRPVAPLRPLRDLPSLPEVGSFTETRRRLDEYFLLGRRLGLDFTDFEARFGAANLSDDLASLEVLAREMFVHLASALAEEYESTLARRNEVAQLLPTPSADVEFDAIRRAIGVGDLTGAQRRLTHVRDELVRVEEEWEVGRILITECDLLVATVRDLGGDPAPALGPLEEGRKFLNAGRRSEAERLLARAAMALWAVLEPRFFEELKRLRDRLVEIRANGGDAGPAVQSLREIAAELRQRNFVGTVVAYRNLKGYIDRVSPPEVSAPTTETIPAGRTSPYA